MKLNNVIGKDEQVILENIRRCKHFSGQGFKVIFRNDGLSSKECENFVKRNEKMLFEIKTQITSMNSPFDNCWFLIDSDEDDLCQKRYSFKGSILMGIAEYIKVVKHLKGKENENSDNWK
tara:strand:+ start:29 stop:388 length:360 start_codon:yes stop_codon:yes gene_type:complete